MELYKKFALVPENVISKHVPSLEQLSELDNEMQNILQNKNLSDYEKVQRYYGVLQKKFSMENYNVPHIAVQESEKHHPEKEVKLEPHKKPSNLFKEIIIKSVHKPFQKKAEVLLELLKNQPDVINWNEKGELLYKGRHIEKSNVADLFHYIFSPTSKSSPIGKHEFLNAFDDLNIPKHFIKNRSMIHREISGVVQQEKIISVKKKKKNYTPVIHQWTSL